VPIFFDEPLEDSGSNCITTYHSSSRPVGGLPICASTAIVSPEMNEILSSNSQLGCLTLERTPDCKISL
jgi:hypothetical protein